MRSHDYARRVLVDNSALRVFALRDPSARATNRLLRILGAVPVVTVFTVEEVLHGLLEDPNREEIRRRCDFILSLNRLWIIPPREECIWFEYTRQTAIPRLGVTFESVQRTVALLRLCSAGQLPSHIADEGKKHYAGLPAAWERSVEHILGGRSVEDIRVAPFEAICNVPDLALTAEKLVINELVRQGESVDNGLLLGAIMNAARSNGRAPYIAGETRIHAWSNWQIAREGTVKRAFREDLKLLVSALYSDFVLTRDEDYFKHGPVIFPEITFVRPNTFIKNG